MDQQQKPPQQLRFPSQSPIRRSKRRRTLVQPSQTCKILMLIASVVRTICLRHFPLCMTVIPVAFFFVASWSQLQRSQLDDDFHSKRKSVPRNKHASRKRHSRKHSSPGLRSIASLESPQQLGSENRNKLMFTTTWSEPMAPAPTRLLSALDQQRRMSYNASACPVLPRGYQPSAQVPVPIHFVVGASPASLDSPTSNMPTGWLLDGLEQSRFLQVVAVSYYHNPRHVWTAQRVVQDAKAVSPLVWVVDWSSLQQDCHALVRVLQSEATHPISSSQQYLLLLDVNGNNRQDVVASCRSLLSLYFGEEGNKVRLAKRSIVQQRYWNDVDNWVHVGQIVPQLVDQPGASSSAGGPRPVLHIPLVVRDDIIKLLYNLTKTTSKHNSLLHWNQKRQHQYLAYPSSDKRFADVTFFWRKGDYSHYGKLRRMVSEVVQSLNNAVLYQGPVRNKVRNRVRTLVRIFGDEDGMEQGIVQLDYVQQLLSTKIVVVAQRDEWEDQHGLLEAMACGAMVMTDVMLSLPPGLVNGKHVVVYDSAESLRGLILYYLHPAQEQKRLSIAKHGWKVVMERHRSWHRMEELIFGKSLTATGPPFEVTPTGQRAFWSG